MFKMCEICGYPSDHGHHIIYKSKWREGIYVADNIIRLCSSCHNKVHNKEIKIPNEQWMRANRAYGNFKEGRRSLAESLMLYPNNRRNDNE